MLVCEERDGLAFPPLGLLVVPLREPFGVARPQPGRLQRVHGGLDLAAFVRALREQQLPSVRVQQPAGVSERFEPQPPAAVQAQPHVLVFGPGLVLGPVVGVGLERLQQLGYPLVRVLPSDSASQSATSSPVSPSGSATWTVQPSLCSAAAIPSVASLPPLSGVGEDCDLPALERRPVR